MRHSNIKCHTLKGCPAAVVFRCNAGLFLEELHKCGSVREIQVTCYLQNACIRIVQLQFGLAVQQIPDKLHDGFPTQLFHDGREVLRRYVQLFSIERCPVFFLEMGNGQFDERLEDDIIAMYVVVSVIAWRYLFYQIGCFDKEPHKGIQYGGLLKGMSRITDFPVDMPETAGYGIPQLYRYRYDGADLPLYGNGTSHDPVRRSYLFLEFLGDEQIYRFEILAELAHMEQVCNGQMIRSPSLTS